MNRETIENILNFLKEKENKESPKKWKLIHELENHPDGAQYRYKGNLVLSNSNITKLPNDLYVDGYFSLFNCEQLKKLPDKLYIKRNLDLVRCKQLTKLPNDLYVGRSLVWYESNITELPNKFYGGKLFLTDCKQLTKLPDNLHIGGSLSLEGSNITELPDNLHIGGSLSLANTPLVNKYTDEEIREMITSTGGEIIGEIYTY